MKSKRAATVARRIPVFGLAAALPAVGLVLAFMVFPIGSTMYHSFTIWDGQSTRFSGFGNYRLLWQDPAMRQALLNSVIFLISVPAIVVASLLAAVLIYQQVPGWRVFRILFFLPSVLSSVVVGALVTAMVSSNGIANIPLHALGLPPISWLGSAWPARVVIMTALVWTSFGFGMLIVLSAMSNIDPSLYDAALVDGASWWRQLVSITLPLVSEALQFISVINALYTLTSLFGFVFVITSGGPGFSTTTIDYYTYVTTFENGTFGYGSALAMVLFVLVLLLTVLQLKLFSRKDS